MLSHILTIITANDVAPGHAELLEVTGDADWTTIAETVIDLPAYLADRRAIAQTALDTLARDEQVALELAGPADPAHDGDHWPVRALAKPGRPPVGPAIQIRLPQELLDDIDELADEAGVSRAAAIRDMLQEQMHRERSWTVTVESRHDRVQSVASAHTSRAAAVAALRQEQQDDEDARQNSGLPGRDPRVEHDGVPVDCD